MIDVSLIILCGLAGVALARRQSAALRHWILAAAIGCAAAAPLLPRVLPLWDLALPELGPMLADAAAGVRPPESAGNPVTGGSTPLVQRQEIGTARWSASRIVAWLWRAWILGAALSFLVLFIGVCRLVWLSARAERLREGPWVALSAGISREYGVRREIAILESRHPALLVTWGVLHPAIMLPAGARDWPEARVRVVLSHELAHIQRGDWIPQLLAEILRSAFWFNPLLWIASGRLRLESERACDDAVLRRGIAGPEYAAHLLDLARAARQHRLRLTPGFPAPAMARPCSLERRVTAMLTTGINRTPTTRSARTASALVLLAFTVLVAGIGAGAQSFATFSGSVLDPMNAAVPTVTVVLTNVQTGARHEVRSDDTGRFEFVGLLPGDYAFEATYPGFASLKGQVTVSGQDVQKTLAMQIGSLQETIRVAASPASATSALREDGQALSTRAVEPCTVSESGGNLRPPLKISDVRPVYPQSARDNGLGGRVLLEARIDGDGLVNDVTVHEADDEAFADAAVDAVRQWQFTPTLLNCTPIDVAMKVNVTFAARNSSVRPIRGSGVTADPRPLETA